MRIAAHSRMQADRIVLETVVSKKVREAWSKDTGKISCDMIHIQDMPDEQKEKQDNAQADGAGERNMHGQLLCADAG